MGYNYKEDYKYFSEELKKKKNRYFVYSSNCDEDEDEELEALLSVCEENKYKPLWTTCKHFYDGTIETAVRSIIIDLKGGEK